MRWKNKKIKPLARVSRPKSYQRLNLESLRKNRRKSKRQKKQLKMELNKRRKPRLRRERKRAAPEMHLLLNYWNSKNVLLRQRPRRRRLKEKKKKGRRLRREPKWRKKDKQRS